MLTARSTPDFQVHCAPAWGCSAFFCPMVKKFLNIYSPNSSSTLKSNHDYQPTSHRLEHKRHDRRLILDLDLLKSPHSHAVGMNDATTNKVKQVERSNTDGSVKYEHNFLNMDRPEHHSIDRLKERGVEKGSGRDSTLQGRERSVFNQTNNISTVSWGNLGKTAKRRGGARMGLSERYDAILS